MALASGGGSVANETLAQFDPTLLLNGLYDLVLTARNAAGQTASQKISVVVDGQMKIGHFTLSFVDLAVPVSGLSIEVVRTYDSRDTRQGDFGARWSLDVRQGSYRNNRPPGDGWQFGQGFLPCDTEVESKSHLTTVRLSDLEVYRFVLRLGSGVPSTSGGCFAEARFDYVDGPTLGATLDILGGTQVFWANGSNQVTSVDTLDLFEPRQVRLTTRDGRTFDLDLDEGVTRLEDRNGNELAITETGLTHSSGFEVSFQRDAEGRIEGITDPAGAEMNYTYDASGDLVSFEDRAGGVTSFEYQADQLLTAIRTGSGKTLLTASFANDGRVEQQCDGDLNCTELVHDLDAREERRVDPTARVTTFRYDERGNVIAIVDGLGNQTRLEYDADDRVVKRIDPLGAVTESLYDGDDLVQIVTPYPDGEDAADYTTVMNYDPSGNLTELTLPDGSQWVVTYDPRGNATEVRDGDGRGLLQNGYDTNGNITSETTRFGTMTFEDLNAFGEPRREVGPLGQATDVTYGVLGEVASFTRGGVVATFQNDAVGRESRADYGDGLWHETTYDELGRWAGDSSPLSGSVTRQLDGAGRLAAWSLPGGTSRTYERDGAGRLLAEVDPLGRRFENTYDAAGRMISMTDAGGATTSFELDAAGQATRMINGLGHATELTYWPDGGLKTRRDPLGNEMSIASGSNWSEVTDALSRVLRNEIGSEGEVTRVVYPDGTEASLTYLEDAPQGEKEDYKTAFTDEAGETWGRVYDSVGRLASVADPSPATWTYAYTGADLVSVTTPSGDPLFTQVWDGFNNLTSRTYPDGGIETYGYGLGPNPTSITLPSGEAVTVTYDIAGRPLSRSTDSGEAETYQWNAIGDLVSATGESGSVSYGYDVAGRLSSLTRSDGAEVLYGHDLVGQVTGVSVRGPGATETHATTYSYDATGRVTSVEDSVGGITSWIYDAVGRPTSRTLPNGIVTEYGYDLRDRVSSIVHRQADGTVLASFSYERGPRGEPTRIVREDGSSREYGYDAAFRLIEEREIEAPRARKKRRRKAQKLSTERRWEYDASGNRFAMIENGVRVDAEYLPGLRLAQVLEGTTVTESYGWDAGGRMSSIDRDGSIQTLSYDSEDQLTAIEVDGESLSYTYDAEGRRIGAEEAGTIRDFVVAPSVGAEVDQIHLASDGTSSVVYSWMGNTPLARTTSSGTVYYLTDGIGNVIGLADETGTVTASFDYGPFGVVRSETGAATPPTQAGGDFRFHGGWQDETTGLVHFGAREYDPATGRFLSRDPAEPDLADPQSLHPYVFASSNPMVFTDPTGLFGISIAEVNVTLSTQSMMASLRTGVKIALKERLKQKLGEAMTSLFTNFLDQTIGMGLQDFIFTKVGFNDLKPWELGRLFELSVRDTVCEWFPVNSSWLWFEPGIDQRTGEPVSNGLSCEERERSVGRIKDNRYPDLIIKRIAPRADTEKTILTGEFKIGVGTFYRAWIKSGAKQKEQGRAIALHARDFSYPPKVVFLLALKKGRRYQHKDLIRFFRRFGARATVRTLF